MEKIRDSSGRFISKAKQIKIATLKRNREKLVAAEVHPINSEAGPADPLQIPCK
jgi:hypothetical protein